MSKLANHIALFWSHDNTGYLVKLKLIQSLVDQNEFTSLYKVVIYSYEMSNEMSVWINLRGLEI